MSNYQDILNMFENLDKNRVASSEKELVTQSQDSEIAPLTNTNNIKLFNVKDFISQMASKSIEKNKRLSDYQTNINAYDLTSNCIRQIILKILNYPIESNEYKDLYLPIVLKGDIGRTIHSFIQDNYTGFTELEASIKVPSIRTSVRLDALINDNVLIEIKSLPFDKFEKILKTRKPRDPDFFQCILYRYLLHNHLKEAKEQIDTRTKPPKLDKYNITHFQIIYVASDILSSDVESVTSAMKDVKAVKKLLNSRYNQFYFILPLDLNTNSFDPAPYENYLVSKIAKINEYLDSKKIPPKDDQFCADGSCFYCHYSRICDKI